MSADTIPARLFQQAEIRPGAPAYYVKSHGGWQMSTWREYVAEVRTASRALIALGFEPRQSVCILGFNRAEWTIMDLACMCVGGAPAGIYTTCSPVEVRYILHHAEAPIALVENEEQWKKIDEQRDNLPHLRHVVLMKGAKKVDDPLVLGWEEFLAKADGVDDAKLDERVEALEPGGLATLIYTSGTTGPPKGVMLSHENLAWTAKVAQQITGSGPDDCSLSYLPLSHIAEQMFTLHGPCTFGGSVYFAESVEKVADNLKEVQPTVFFGVPRIWEKFRSGISGKLAEATGAKKALVDWAMGVGRTVNEGRMRGRGEPAGLLALKYKLADRLIFSKLKPAVGLGRAKVCVSGAAPIARKVLEFFASLDILVLEVYGQSEDTGPTSFNRRDCFFLGSVGPAIPGVEVKIAEDDEILVHGPNVFLGYYKEPEATAETLVDGWLHSGDLGRFDDKGFLHITGRKKEILITAGGKNVAPKNIEAALKNHPLINEAVVIGDRRKYLTVLLTLDPEASGKWAEEHGADPETLHSNATLRAELQKALDATNKDLARVEQIKKFEVLRRNFSVESGELTPTLKVKRKQVYEHFSDTIESMYAE